MYRNDQSSWAPQGIADPRRRHLQAALGDADDEARHGPRDPRGGPERELQYRLHKLTPAHAADAGGRCEPDARGEYDYSWGLTCRS